MRLWVLGDDCNCNCLTSRATATATATATAVSPPLRGGDLLSCLAKKVGKEGAPDGATTPSGFGEKSGRDPNSHRLKAILRHGSLFSALFVKSRGAPYGLGTPSRLASHRHGCFPPPGGKHGRTSGRGAQITIRCSRDCRPQAAITRPRCAASRLGFHLPLWGASSAGKKSGNEGAMSEHRPKAM